MPIVLHFNNLILLIFTQGVAPRGRGFTVGSILRELQ